MEFIEPSKAGFQRLLTHSKQLYAEEMCRYGEFNDEAQATQAAGDEIKIHLQVTADTLAKRSYDLISDNIRVGYIWFSVNEMMTANNSSLSVTAFLAYLFIDKPFRRRGLAYQALAQYEKMCCDEFSAKMSTFYVFKGNHNAIALYQKSGYVIVEEETFYEGKVPTRWRMQKLL